MNSDCEASSSSTCRCFRATTTILIVAISYLLLTIAFNYSGKELPLGFYLPGWDFNVIAQGSLKLAGNRSPYFDRLFVTPPGSALFILPFAKLPEEYRRLVFFVLSYAAVFLSTLSVFYFCAKEKFLRSILLTTTAVILSYPVLFGTERGNLDPWITFIIGLVLVALYQGRPCLSGFLLALGVHLKLYPIVLLVPLAVMGGIPALLSFIATAMFIVGLLPQTTCDFAFHRLVDRVGREELNIAGTTPTVSAISAFVYLFSHVLPHLGVPALTKYAYGLWGALLTTRGLLDFRARHTLARSPYHRVACMSRYIPFAVAVPNLAFQYELSNLLLMLPLLDGMAFSSTRLRKANAVWAALVITALVVTQVNHPAITGVYNRNWIWWMPGCAVLSLTLLFTFSTLSPVEQIQSQTQVKPPSKLSMVITALCALFGLASFAYRALVPREVPYSTMQVLVPPGIPWNCEGCIWVGRGIKVALPSPISAKRVSLSLDHNDTYAITIEFVNNKTESSTVGPTLSPTGLVPYSYELHSQDPVKAIFIRPISGDSLYSVAGLRLE